MRSPAERVRDEWLVLRCQRGEPEAFDALIRAWEPRLAYYARRLVDDEAEAADVVQATWVRVVRGIGSLRDASRLAGWLYATLRRTALNHSRQTRRRLARVALANGHVEDPATAGDEGRFDDAERVHRGLAKLDLPQRELLTLFFLQDLSIDEIATVVGVPGGTVKSRLHHAKRELRRVLDEESRHG